MMSCGTPMPGTNAKSDFSPRQIALAVGVLSKKAGLTPFHRAAHDDGHQRKRPRSPDRPLADRRGGYVAGDSNDFDRDHAVDLAKLFDFLNATQPEAVEALAIGEEGPKRLQFPAPAAGRDRQARGHPDVLRNGVETRPRLGGAVLRHTHAGQRQGRGAVRRQTSSASPAKLHYSKDATKLSLDVGLSSTVCPSPLSS